MFTTAAYIALFLLCSYGIFTLDLRKDSLSKSVFIAMFLGHRLAWTPTAST